MEANISIENEEGRLDDEVKKSKEVYPIVRSIFRIANITYPIVYGLILMWLFFVSQLGGGDYAMESLFRIICTLVIIFLYFMFQLFWHKSNENIWMWLALFFCAVLVPLPGWTSMNYDLNMFHVVSVLIVSVGVIGMIFAVKLLFKD